MSECVLSHPTSRLTSPGESARGIDLDGTGGGNAEDTGGSFTGGVGEAHIVARGGRRHETVTFNKVTEFRAGPRPPVCSALSPHTHCA